MIGVALALLIMELTVAIVLGFKDGIRSKLMGFDAQITVEAPANTYGSHLEAEPQLMEVLQRELPDADIRLTLRQPALIKTDSDFHGLVFLAQQPTGSFDFERSNIVEGVWPDYAADSCDNQVVISRQVANALGIRVGDKITSTFFVDGSVKMRRPVVAGIFQSNFGEYDYNMAYASLNAMQRIAGLDSLGGNRIDIRGVALDDIQDEAYRLQKALVDAAAHGDLTSLYPVDNITHSGAMYFSWLDLLDTNVVVIFILMLAVSGLTIISSLFILILERIRLIGVLRAMGASKPMVRKIFVDMAMRLVGRGLIIGNILGIGLMLLQKYTHVLKLDPQMYYLDAVPIVINPWAILALNVGVAVVAWLVLVLPARLASSIDPAKAISFE